MTRWLSQAMIGANRNRIVEATSITSFSEVTNTRKMNIEPSTNTISAVMYTAISTGAAALPTGSVSLRAYMLKRLTAARGYPSRPASTVENITATASHADATAGPENTINGSGLNDQDQHSIDAPDMWLASPGEGEPVWIQYEFDGVYKLHEMLVWNYNVQFEIVLGFGLKDVTIEYSTDGSDWTTLGDFEFSQATAAACVGTAEIVFRICEAIW